MREILDLAEITRYHPSSSFSVFGAAALLDDPRSSLFGASAVFAAVDELLKREPQSGSATASLGFAVDDPPSVPQSSSLDAAATGLLAVLPQGSLLVLVVDFVVEEPPHEPQPSSLEFAVVFDFESPQGSELDLLSLPQLSLLFLPQEDPPLFPP